jgi:hypothetical protein
MQPMPKRKAAARADAPLQRFTEAVITGRVRKPWSWAELRARHFRAESDEASQKMLAEWAKQNGIEWDLQPGTVRLGKSRQEIRVVVLEAGRRPPIRRRVP